VFPKDSLIAMFCIPNICREIWKKYVFEIEFKDLEPEEYMIMNSFLRLWIFKFGRKCDSKKT